MKVMECRPIEVKLISGKKLKNVNVLSRMDVYVVGSVSGDPRSIQRTAVHKDGGVNPTWNHVMKFNMDESAARLNRLGLVFQIMSDRTLGDKEIGRVYVPLKELFHAVGDIDEKTGEISGEEKHVVYQVQTASGKFKGQLEFSYKFGKKFTQSVLPLDERGYESSMPFEPKINDPQSISNPKYDEEPSMAYPTGPGPSHMHEQYHGPGPEQRANPALAFEPKINEPYSMSDKKCDDEPVMAYPTGLGQYHVGPGPSTYQGVGGAAPYNYGVPPPPGYPNQGVPPPPGYPNQGYNQGCGNENAYGYGSGYGHPPPPHSNPNMGYGYPPGGGYSYPGQASTGYMQQPVQPPKKKNNKFGLGAAAGVGAGLLGGLVVGEMVEDVAEEAAFDDDAYDW